MPFLRVTLGGPSPSSDLRRKALIPEDSRESKLRRLTKTPKFDETRGMREGIFGRIACLTGIILREKSGDKKSRGSNETRLDG